MAKKLILELKLYDDEESRSKELLLSKLEIMFDDRRNVLPLEYYRFVSELPYGSNVKVTFEII
jgi:hypothetical protein